MKRLLGSTFVVVLTFGSVLLPAPSGAAVSTVTCHQLTGNVTFKPPLPLDQSKGVVTTMTMTGGKLSSCNGSKTGRTGRLSFSVKTKQRESCRGMTIDGWTATGRETIRWESGRQTTVALTLAGDEGFRVTLPSANGPVIAGFAKGRRQIAGFRLSAPGSCSGKPGVPSMMKMATTLRISA